MMDRRLSLSRRMLVPCSVGPEEVRAWNFQLGIKAPAAAGVSVEIFFFSVSLAFILDLTLQLADFDFFFVSFFPFTYLRSSTVISRRSSFVEVSLIIFRI